MMRRSRGAGRVLQEDPVYKPALRVTAATQARVGMRRQALAAVTRPGQVDPDSRVGPCRRPLDVEMFQDSLRKAGLSK
jgi:hypothetical protein